MVLTRQMARKDHELESQPPSTFHSFSCLPTELRTMIWNFAEDSQPGHVIEVCNIPNHFDNTGRPTSYEWYAIPCRCKKRCFEPPLARVNQESRKVALNRRSRCFDHWVDWKKDIIFIGSRVGHLHNTGFLRALELRNCREKLRYLAIDYDCWHTSRIFMCTVKKECTPAAMISRLPGLQKLTFARTVGAWRDGSEFRSHDPGYIMDEWRVLQPHIQPGYDDLVKYEKEKFSQWLLYNNYEETDVWNSLPEKPDMWRCYSNFHDATGEKPGSYKPNTCLDDESRYGGDGNCGVALIQFDKVENAYWWGPGGEDFSFRMDWMLKEFDQLKCISRSRYPGAPDYTTWTPPEIDFALTRKTAPSCFTDDWEGLERQWMYYGEAAWARDHPESYKARDKSKDYPAGQHLGTYKKLYWGADGFLLDG
ncbi:ffea0b3e-48f6-4700-adc1-f561343add27-CDS [Sclerotinia trifoliorum]|uniref:Ffea0b3e-48f6-4700-adc1-f561343add27-CDS n=1 Tax=Sclerotinia trifoliorum TaxID=28548 RepID=A0A8H2ZSB9_9HELO|nr:ffea0b3e-48f6-4700-adc1-f561343add27-CDS [Sclerotinia trifoliorum]